jgi:hypothetical protein
MKLTPEDRLSNADEVIAKVKNADPLIDDEPPIKRASPSIPSIPANDYKYKYLKRDILCVRLADFEKSGPVRLVVKAKGGQGRMAVDLFDSFVFQATTNIPVPPNANPPFTVHAFRRPMKISRQSKADGTWIDPGNRKSWPVIAQIRGMDHAGEACTHYDDPCPPSVEYGNAEIRDTKKVCVLYINKVAEFEPMEGVAA